MLATGCGSRGPVSLLVIVVALALLVGCSEAKNMRGMNIKKIHDGMYGLLSGYPCVRLLNSTNVIGCAPSGSPTGPLQFIETKTELDAFIAKQPFGKSSVLLVPDLFNQENVDRLIAEDTVSAILVMWGKHSAGISPDYKAPSSKFGSAAAYAWNPLGDGMMWNSYKTPIWLLSANESATLLSKAQENKLGKSPRWAVTAHAKMYASKDSETCLRRDTCMPVGGQSVWSGLAEVSSDKEIVLATATLDTNSFFHDQAPGAEGYLSGVIALLAAQIALADLAPSLPKQVLFSYFTGEAWDHLGSRKFVHDLQNFQCLEVDKSNNLTCKKPYVSSMKFQGISLAKVSALIDVSQVAVSLSNNSITPSLWIHKEQADSANKDLTSKIMASSLASTDLTVAMSTASVDPSRGIPPSPASAFLRANPSIPVAVITNHESTFTNKYYHSHYDTTIDSGALCEVSTLIARSIYAVAYGSVPPNQNSLVANCSLVSDLVYCFTVNFDCPLVERYFGPVYMGEGNNTITFYTGVYGSAPDSVNIHLVSALIYTLLTERTAYSKGMTNCSTKNACAEGYECVGSEPESVCVKANVNYHNAISLGIEWSYKHEYWYISNKSEPCWTESIWETPYLEYFRQDTLAHDVGILIGGLAELFICVAVIWFGSRLLSKHFKLL